MNFPTGGGKTEALRQYGAGCPYCAGRRLLRGFNDLATKFPDVAAEWSEKNLPQKADDVLAFSNQKAWWQGKCGHEYTTDHS